MIILRTKNFGLLTDIKDMWDSIKAGKSLGNKIKGMIDFTEKNHDKLESIVKKNLLTNNQLLRLSQFEKESNKLFEEADNYGYEINARSDIKSIINCLGDFLYSDSLRGGINYTIPEDYPIPIISIYGSMDLTEETYLLWYNKKTGWIDRDNNKKYNGPKQFILDCINNKIDTFEVEDEDWFPKYKENFIKLVNKYLW